MGPFYGDVAAAHGFEKAVAAVRAANKRPMPGLLNWPAEADRLLDQLAVFGGSDDVRNGFEVLDELADALPLASAPDPSATSQR
jgi:hypothetical protein